MDVGFQGVLPAETVSSRFLATAVLFLISTSTWINSLVLNRLIGLIHMLQ